jgi:hypothetical protein
MGKRRLATARGITLPFTGSDSPRAQVVATLERMGCLVSGGEGDVITGLTAGDGLSWGQEVTVTIEPGRLRVRSSFSSPQVFGAKKNQKAVDRFKLEWERRGEPWDREWAEAVARDNAWDALGSGGLWVGLGVAILLLVLFVPAQPGGSPGGKFYLAGTAFVALAYGLPRVRAALARLRRKTDR